MINRFIATCLILVGSLFSATFAYADNSIEQDVRQQVQKIAEMNQAEQRCAEGVEGACDRYNQLATEVKDNSMKLSPGFIDKFSGKFAETVKKWLPPIQKAATYLLFTLGLIALVIRMLPLVLRGGDMGEIVKELIVFIMTIGIWFALILNAKDWSGDIISSFAKLADLSSGSATGTTPLDVLQSGFVVVGKILTSTWNPITLLMYVLLSVVLIVIYCMIAFYILKVTLETVIITYAGLLMVGFAGIEYTRDYAKRYFTYMLSVGFKYFLTILIAGFGITFINEIVSDTQFGNVGACLGVICVVLMLWKLVEEIPNMAQSMVTGASLGGGNMNIGSAMATMTAAATAFAAAAYAGVAAFKAAGAANAAGGGAGAAGAAGSSGGAGAGMQGGQSGGAGAGSMAQRPGAARAMGNAGVSAGKASSAGPAKPWPEEARNALAEQARAYGKKMEEREAARQSPYSAAKAAVGSLVKGTVNKASGGYGSLAQNITKSALKSAADSNSQREKASQNPPAGDGAKIRDGNNDGGSNE